MRALDWLRDPSKYPLKPVYVVHGDDVYLKRESISAISHQALEEQEDEVSISRFEGNQATLADVLDELRTLPFFTKRRLIIVSDADPFVTKYRKDLEAYVEAPSDTGVLVLATKQWTASAKLTKLVEQRGMSIDCAGPAEKELIPWLTHFAKSRHHAQLDADAARLLLELVGAEVGILTAEVEKLAIYVGTTQRIRREDVSKLVEAGRIETVWKVLDACTTGEAAAAIEQLDTLLAAGEHPIGLLAAMSVALLKTYHAGRLRAARLSLEEACRIAGIREFAFDKTRRQHAHLGPARVDRLPAMLLKADLDLKGGSVLEPRVVLETLIVALALPRTD